MATSSILMVTCWVAFFVLHSVTASHRCKDWIASRHPNLNARYRLLYNLVAVITVTPALALALFQPSPLLWQWQGIGRVFYWIVMGLCVWGFAVSSRHYDMPAFLGIAGSRNSHIGKDSEPFSLSTIHRFVRHPWYFIGLVMIWMQDMNLNWLTSCLLMTGYFWYGSRLEESKLLTLYGEPYRVYQQRVAGLVPVPWKILSETEVQQLRSTDS